MVVRDRIAFLLYCALSINILSQEPPVRLHHCPESNPGNQRIIKNSGDIVLPKLISKKLPEVSHLQQPLGPNSSPIGFVILINEKGRVECVEHLKGAEGNPELIDACMSVIREWVYEIPKDAAGQPVSCYIVLTVLLHPEK